MDEQIKRRAFGTIGVMQERVIFVLPLSHARSEGAAQWLHFFFVLLVLGVCVLHVILVELESGPIRQEQKEMVRSQNLEKHADRVFVVGQDRERQFKRRLSIKRRFFDE